MVDPIRTFFLESDRLNGSNPMAFLETIGSVPSPSQSPPPSSVQATSHAAGEKTAMSIRKFLPECSGPFAAFLFALGMAFGAYVLLPHFLPHKWTLPPEDRSTVANGYLLF